MRHHVPNAIATDRGRSNDVGAPRARSTLRNRTHTQMWSSSPTPRVCGLPKLTLFASWRERARKLNGANRGKHASDENIAEPWNLVDHIGPGKRMAHFEEVVARLLGLGEQL